MSPCILGPELFQFPDWGSQIIDQKTMERKAQSYNVSIDKPTPAQHNVVEEGVHSIHCTILSVQPTTTNVQPLEESQHGSQQGKRLQQIPVLGVSAQYCCAPTTQICPAQGTVPTQSM